MTDKEKELQAEAIGYLRKRIAELEAQIEKMKCCGNCRFSENDKLNGTLWTQNNIPFDDKYEQKKNIKNEVEK